METQGLGHEFHVEIQAAGHVAPEVAEGHIIGTIFLGAYKFQRIGL